MNILIKIAKSAWYLTFQSKTYMADILGSFLTDDVVTRSEKWIVWLNDPQYQDTLSNRTFLFKDENNMVDLHDIFDLKTNIERYLSIKKIKLIELLRQWNITTQKKPNYIYIYLDTETSEFAFETSELYDYQQEKTHLITDPQFGLIHRTFEHVVNMVGDFLIDDVKNNPQKWIMLLKNNPSYDEIIIDQHNPEQKTRIINSQNKVFFGQYIISDGPNYPFDKHDVIQVLEQWDLLTKFDHIDAYLIIENGTMRIELNDHKIDSNKVQ